MAQPDFYHLEVDSENVEFTCYLNGLPVYMAKDKFEATVSLPVQLYLIGKSNKLMIQAKTIDKSKEGKISAKVVPYEKGDIVATDEEKISKISVVMELKDKSSKEIMFDNERFDFSEVIIKGEQLKEDEVMNYARQLSSYLEKGDAAGFVGEMNLKIIDYGSANSYTAEEMREGLTQQFKQTFFKKKNHGIAVDRISLHSFNDGRVWEIKVDGAEFLKYSEEDNSMQMSVYVGSVKGKLGIVR